MKNEIAQFIIQKVLGESPNYDLATDDDLLGSGLISSMGVFRVISFVEKNFGIKVPAQDMVIENFMSIDAIEAYTKRQIK